MGVEFYKSKLSGCTNGKMIEIAATSTPGTLVHTAVSGTTDWDEVWIQAVNHHSANVVLTLEWGGVTVNDDLVVQTIPFQDGLHWVVQGMVLQNGLVVRAFAGTTNVISLIGYVNQVRTV